MLPIKGTKVHPLSAPCTKAEFDLFTCPITQVVISSKGDQYCLPATTINNNSKRIEFNLPPFQDFVDLDDI